LEYESLQPLYESLAMLKNNKNIGVIAWAKFMHHAMMKATKVIIQVASHIIFSCDGLYN
jgi:hypothetical protein